MMERDPYKLAGYDNRKEYLKGLSEDYNIKLSDVLALADMLGPAEDFDGLVVALEDASDMAWDRDL